MLESDSAGFEDCRDIWQVTNVERLHALQKQVRKEQLAGDESVWNVKAIPKSYLQNRINWKFIAAAGGSRQSGRQYP